MVYLVPFSIFRNQYADSLRKYILDGIEEIIDLTGIKVFQGITCSVTYFIYKKGTTEDSIHYVIRLKMLSVIQKKLKWILHSLLAVDLFIKKQLTKILLIFYMLIF